MEVCNGSKDGFHFEKQNMESCWPPIKKEVTQRMMGVQNKTNIYKKRNKFKAQLVVKEYEQRARINFDKTFVLVIKWNMMKSIVVLVVHKKWELLHLDVKIAILNNNVKKDVCIV